MTFLGKSYIVCFNLHLKNMPDFRNFCKNAQNRSCQSALIKQIFMIKFFVTFIK